MTAICSICRQVIRPSMPIVGRSADPAFRRCSDPPPVEPAQTGGQAAMMFGFNVQALKMFRIVAPPNAPKFYEMIGLTCVRLAELPGSGRRGKPVCGGDGLYVLLLRKGNGMQISYDKETDALYIRLLEGDFQCRTVRVTDEIALDFAAGEKIVGIEALGASHLFKNQEAPQVELKHLLPQVAA